MRGERNLFYVVTDADRNGDMIAFFYGFLAPLDEALELLHVRQIPEALLGSHEEARGIKLIQGIGDERFLGIFRRIPEVADLQQDGGVFGGCDAEALMIGIRRQEHKTAVCHDRFKTAFLIRKIGVNEGKEGIVFLKTLFAGGAAPHFSRFP